MTLNFLLTRSFFDPLLTSDGQPYSRVRFKSILQEQVLIGYLTKGGVTYRDTEEMSPYERKLVLDTMKEVIDGQKNQVNSTVINDPKTRMTS